MADYADFTGPAYQHQFFANRDGPIIRVLFDAAPNVAGQTFKAYASLQPNPAWKGVAVDLTFTVANGGIVLTGTDSAGNTINPAAGSIGVAWKQLIVAGLVTKITGGEEGVKMYVDVERVDASPNSYPVARFVIRVYNPEAG